MRRILLTLWYKGQQLQNIFVINPASRNEVISNKGIGLQNNKEWYGPKWYAPLYWYVGVVMHGVSRHAVTGDMQVTLCHDHTRPMQMALSILWKCLFYY
jgi:hypothetical protein